MAQKKNDSGWNSYAEMLWQFVSPKTPDGKNKSTILLYSFGLSLLYVAVYASCYALIVPVIESAFASSLNAHALIFAEMLLPALVGFAVCSVFFWVGKDKRLVPAAYAWMAGYAFVFLIIMMLLANNAEERKFLLYLFGLFVPMPVFLGNILSGLIFLKQRKRKK